MLSRTTNSTRPDQNTPQNNYKLNSTPMIYMPPNLPRTKNPLSPKHTMTCDPWTHDVTHLTHIMHTRASPSPFLIKPCCWKDLAFTSISLYFTFGRSHRLTYAEDVGLPNNINRFGKTHELFFQCQLEKHIFNPFLIISSMNIFYIQSAFYF